MTLAVDYVRRPSKSAKSHGYNSDLTASSSLKISNFESPTMNIWMHIDIF
jgi:hypothetical protein